MSLPPEVPATPAKANPWWCTAIWCVFALALLLLWNLNATFQPITGANDSTITAVSIVGLLIISTLVFAVLNTVAAQSSDLSLSIAAYFLVSAFIVAAIITGFFVLRDITPSEREYLIPALVIWSIIIPFLLIPVGAAAWLAAYFPASPGTNRRTFAVMMALIFAEAVPGVWITLSEPPFYALVRHDPFAAGNALVLAITGYTGNDTTPPDNSENRVRGAVRAWILADLPANVQIAYAQRSDAVGKTARATLKYSMHTNPAAARDAVLAEIARQGGAASGPDTWWMFDAAAGALAERVPTHDGHRDATPPPSIDPIHDPAIEALLLDRLAMAYTHPAGAGINEARTLANALGNVTVAKDAVALRMLDLLKAKPEIAWDIWLGIGGMRSAAANEKLGAWIVANGGFGHAYSVPERLVVHTIAKDSAPLREAFLTRFRAGKLKPAYPIDRYFMAQSEWAAVQSWETPPEVTADLSSYLSNLRGGDVKRRLTLLSNIAHSKHPKARAVVDGAMPGILAVADDWTYRLVMESLLAVEMAGDTRLIHDALSRFSKGNPPEGICGADSLHIFASLFKAGHLKNWFATDEGRTATLHAFDLLALDEGCRDWLRWNATSARVVWPAERDRSIKALAQCDGSAAKCPHELLRYLAAIAGVDADAQAIVNAYTARGGRLP